MAPRIAIYNDPASLLYGAALAFQPQEVYTKARAQAAACISPDPDCPSLSQGLDHPSKADAAYSVVLIQP